MFSTIVKYKEELFISYYQKIKTLRNNLFQQLLLYSLRFKSARIYRRHNLREKLLSFMAAIQTGNSEICTNPTAIIIWGFVKLTLQLLRPSVSEPFALGSGYDSLDYVGSTLLGRRCNVFVNIVLLWRNKMYTVCKYIFSFRFSTILS